MNENLMLLGIIVLWFILMTILGRNAFVYYKKKSMRKMLFTFLSMIVIAVFSGEWILFFIWSLACDVGINPFSCML